jgi:hypothetical protein
MRACGLTTVTGVLELRRNLRRRNMAETKDVFVINKTGDKSYFNRCGIAFVNKDGSLNLKLDLFPSVQLQVWDRRENETR